MKKFTLLLAAVLVSAITTGCTASIGTISTASGDAPTTAFDTESDNATSRSDTADIPADERQNEAASQAENGGDADMEEENDAPDTIPDENDADVTYAEEATTEFNQLREFKTYFLQEKALLEKSKQAMEARGQYESFEARDFSKYGVWEYEPWHWTDHYGNKYMWPVLYDEGTKDERLLIESDNGHLYSFTYRSQMRRRADLGSLYE